MAGLNGKDDEVRKILVELSVQLCLAEANELLTRGQYQQAQELFTQAKPFVRGSERVKLEQDLVCTQARAQQWLAFSNGLAEIENGQFLAKDAAEKLDGLKAQAREQGFIARGLVNAARLEGLRPQLASLRVRSYYLQARRYYLKRDFIKARLLLERTGLTDKQLENFGGLTRKSLRAMSKEKKRRGQAQQEVKQELMAVTHEAEDLLALIGDEPIAAEIPSMQDALTHLKGRGVKELLAESPKSKEGVKDLITKLQKALKAAMRAKRHVARAHYRMDG